MGRPVSGRPIGEVIAEIEQTYPEAADEIRAALSARRLREDLADAEAILREVARTDPTRIGRSAAVVLVEYDRRGGRVVGEPTRTELVSITRAEDPPAGPVRDTQGDVVLPR